MQKQMKERMGEKEWAEMQQRMKKMEDDFQQRRKVVQNLTEGIVPGQHHCHSDSPDVSTVHKSSAVACAFQPSSGYIELT